MSWWASWAACLTCSRYCSRSSTVRSPWAWICLMRSARASSMAFLAAGLTMAFGFTASISASISLTTCCKLSLEVAAKILASVASAIRSNLSLAPNFSSAVQSLLVALRAVDIASRAVFTVFLASSFLVPWIETLLTVEIPSTFAELSSYSPFAWLTRSSASSLAVSNSCSFSFFSSVVNQDSLEINCLRAL